MKYQHIVNRAMADTDEEMWPYRLIEAVGAVANELAELNGTMKKIEKNFDHHVHGFSRGAWADDETE